jgi:hypothetical protein
MRGRVEFQAGCSSLGECGVALRLDAGIFIVPAPTTGPQLAGPREDPTYSNEKDNDMATDVHEGGTRPEPGLALALLAVLVMVVTTFVLAGLIYVLMLGVSATSAGRQALPGTQQPAAVSPAPQPATPISPAQPATR